MVELDKEQYSQSYINFLYLLAPFQAGYVNAGAFHISSGYFVTHVTGTGTMIGMGMAKLDLKIFLTFLTVLMAFIFGAGLAGYYIKYKKEIGENCNYPLVMLIKCVFFGLVLLLSEFDLFITSEEVIHFSHLLMLFMLSFCCGIQNASSSLATGGFLKPTHMTGLSTDVGANLYLFFNGKRLKDPKGFSDLKMRIYILISFIIGGFFAEIIFMTRGHYGFLFPFMAAMFFFLLSIVRKDKEYQKYLNFYKIALASVFLSTIIMGLASISQYE